MAWEAGAFLGRASPRWFFWRGGEGLETVRACGPRMTSLGGHVEGLRERDFQPCGWGAQCVTGPRFKGAAVNWGGGGSKTTDLPQCPKLLEGVGMISPEEGGGQHRRLGTT